MKSDFFFGGGEIYVDFHVRSTTRSKNMKKWNRLQYSASIYIRKNDVGVTVFHKFDRYFQGDEPPEIWAWTANVVEEFHEKRIKDRIGFMFGDNIPVVLPPVPIYIEAIVRGLVASGEEELLIFKMRHVDGGFESFSYAIFIRDWFVFPDVGATVSGSGRDIEEIDGIIKELSSKIKICLIEFDVDYKDFEEKLLEEYQGIRRDFSEELFDKIRYKKLPADIQQEYALEIQEVHKNIENRKFVHAIRNLRSLIEASGKHLCKLKGIELPEKATKRHIVPSLIKNKILEPRLDSWFNAFYTIADKAAHSVSLQDIDVSEKQYFLRQAIIIGELIYLEILSKIEEAS
ncbi:MAG: hypothetical protein V3U19_10915 [Thermodesulfobacteriota bacterium]